MEYGTLKHGEAQNNRMPHYSVAMTTRTLSFLQRTLQANPAIRQELEKSNGFENIVSEVVLTPAAYCFLDSLFKVNTGLVASDKVGI